MEATSSFKSYSDMRIERICHIISDLGISPLLSMEQILVIIRQRASATHTLGSIQTTVSDAAKTTTDAVTNIQNAVSEAAKKTTQALTNMQTTVSKDAIDTAVKNTTDALENIKNAVSKAIDVFTRTFTNNIDDVNKAIDDVNKAIDFIESFSIGMFFREFYYLMLTNTPSTDVHFINSVNNINRAVVEVEADIEAKAKPELKQTLLKQLYDLKHKLVLLSVSILSTETKKIVEAFQYLGGNKLLVNV